MIWCCIEPERVEKTTPIMQAMARGFQGRTCLGDPPDDGQPFVVWGQLWTALRALPRAMSQGRPFLHIDNGYVDPARGGLTGYYRITVNGMSPAFLPDAPKSRVRARMMPWRETGDHVLLALPGEEFGRAIGLEMRDWLREIPDRVSAHTRRRVQIRSRKARPPVSRDLLNCWALVTHSSMVAVDALLAGVPVFVEPTNCAAPVGNLDLSKLESPGMPDRDPWFNSLMLQQYTLEEMRSGFAAEVINPILKQGSK
jgi:hypothetical protein